MRLRRQCKFRSGFLIANANGHNWVYKKFIQEKRANHSLVQAKTHDFADILPKDYITNLETTLPERLYRRYVLNSHEVTEGLVYDEYDENKHLVEPIEIPDTWEKGFGLDHGVTNPTAVLWYAIDQDGVIWLYDEHYKSGQAPSYHAEEIRLRGMTSGIADPSIFANTQIGKNGSIGKGDIYSVADEYRECGIDLVPSIREVEAGAIARVNEFFKAGKIKVFGSLKNFREEINGWKYKEKRPTANTSFPEEPDDRDNHLCLSGGTMVLTRSGWASMQSLSGYCGEVWTPFGWQDYFCFETGKSELIEITTEDGFSVSGTPAHPLLSTHGWDTMKYIKQGDILYGPNRFKRYDSGIARQALLLGRYSVLPPRRAKEVYDATAQGCMGVKQWTSSRKNVRSPFEREQERQSFGESWSYAPVGTHETPHEFAGEGQEIKRSNKEGCASGSGVAPLTRGQSMAFQALKGDGASNRVFCMPFLRDTMPNKRPEIFTGKVLRPELFKKVSEKKSIKKQTVFNLYVNGARSFYLMNGLVSHNCDVLKYIISSRFPSAAKKKDLPPIGSLAYYDRQQEMDRAYREGRNGKRRW